MNIKTNESTADRLIRIVVGIGLAALGVAGVVSGPLAVVAWVVAGVLLVTGVVGFCPLYAVLHVSTKSSTH
ncbi:MAG: YgaP family membrane protein [Candidatus Limnocylindrales bacterium]